MVGRYGRDVCVCAVDGLAVSVGDCAVGVSVNIFRQCPIYIADPKICSGINSARADGVDEYSVGEQTCEHHYKHL